MLLANGLYAQTDIDNTQVAVTFSTGSIGSLRFGRTAVYGNVDENLVVSRDRGKTWEFLLDKSCTAFLSPVSSDTVWCGGTLSYKSTDGGRTWRALDLPDRRVDYLTFPEVLWIGDAVVVYIYHTPQGSRLRMSFDGGVSASDTPLAGLPAGWNPDSLGYIGSKNGSIYTGQVRSGLLFRLQPGSVAWERVSEKLPCTLEQISMSEASSNKWLCLREEADGNLRLTRSTDYGATWEDLPTRLVLNNGAISNDALRLVYFFKLRYYAVENETTFWSNGESGQLGYPQGKLFRTTDGGMNWSAISGEEGWERDVNNWAANPANSTQIATADRDSILLSSDGGKTWQRRWTNPQLRLSPNQIWWFKGNPSPLIALAYAASNASLAGVIVSFDKGASFVDASYFDQGLPVKPIELTDLAQLTGGVLLLKVSENGGQIRTRAVLYESRDSGLTWHKKYPLPPADLFGNETSMKSDGSTVWLYSYSAIYASKDGGTSWTPFAPGIPRGRNFDVTPAVAALLTYLPFPQGLGLITTTDGGDSYKVTEWKGLTPICDNGGIGEFVTIDPYRIDVFYSFAYTGSGGCGPVRSLTAGSQWEAFAKDLTGRLHSKQMRTFDGRVLLFETDGDVRNLRVTYRVPAVAPDQTVHEFFNVDLKHYFMTASEAEAAGIDLGLAGPGWSRTGEVWRVWSIPGAGALPAYRFYAAGPNSHFFTMDRAEADGLRALESSQRAAAQAAGVPFYGWQYEGRAYAVAPTEDGICTAPLVPLYRLYNDRATQNDSNHRFAIKSAVRQAMIAQGWRDEGVAMCVR